MLQALRNIVTYIFGVFISISVLAAPNLTIDSPDDGAIISSDNTIVSGIASGIGDGQGIDLMLVLDNSDSLHNTDSTKERFEAVRQLLNSFGPNANVHIGMVFFSDNASLDVSLQAVNTANSAINQAIANHQDPSGNTAIGDGIFKASQELTANGRPYASRIILVFTDGENNKGVDPEQEADNARIKGHIVYIVGLFRTFNPFMQQGSITAQLASEKIVKAGGGKLFFSDNPTDLLALFRGSKIVEIESVTVTNTTTGKAAGSVQLATGNYNAPIDLVQGNNVLEVTATDTYGESTTASVTVIVPGSQPSLPPLVDPCIANPYGFGCPTFRSVKLRPQVLMAGFDPMLIDIVDDSFKVVAVVREGMAPILHVHLSENTGNFNTAMTLDGQLSNGDKVYSLEFVGIRGALYQQELSNLFGSGIGEYKITVVDQAQQTHSFPNLEFGNNITLETQAALTQAQPYTRKGIRRLKPQPIMVGFDPVLIDLGDSAFKVKAIVRPGLAAIKHVTLKSGSGFAIAMDKEEDLPNGDEMYSLVYTFQRGAFPDGALRDLFGTDHPKGEFVVEVIDEAQQRHIFPTLQGGNFPEQ